MARKIDLQECFVSGWICKVYWASTDSVHFKCKHCQNVSSNKNWLQNHVAFDIQLAYISALNISSEIFNQFLY